MGGIIGPSYILMVDHVERHKWRILGVVLFVILSRRSVARLKESVSLIR